MHLHHRMHSFLFGDMLSCTNPRQQSKTNEPTSICRDTRSSECTMDHSSLRQTSHEIESDWLRANVADVNNSIHICLRTETVDCHMEILQPRTNKHHGRPNGTEHGNRCCQRFGSRRREFSVLDLEEIVQSDSWPAPSWN